MTGRRSAVSPSFACAFVLLLAANTALAAESAQPLRAGDYEIFYGVVPAEIILGHPGSHEERKMHGGVPRRPGQHHLIVTVFDAKSRERLKGLAITARVGEVGLGTQAKKLETMQLAGSVSYGNYFTMAAPGPYRVELELYRPGSSSPTKATFQYFHPRR